MRLRTSPHNDLNGLQGNELVTHSGSVQGEMMHVVYTHDGSSDMTQIYLDGQRVASKIVPGDLQNWEKYHLGLANELSSNDRPWVGGYYLVAIYDRALTDGEVQRNHKTGPD